MKHPIPHFLYYLQPEMAPSYAAMGGKALVSTSGPERKSAFKTTQNRAKSGKSVKFDPPPASETTTHADGEGDGDGDRDGNRPADKPASEDGNDVGNGEAKMDASNVVEKQSTRKKTTKTRKDETEKEEEREGEREVMEEKGEEEEEEEGKPGKQKAEDIQAWLKEVEETGSTATSSISITRSRY